MRLISEQTPKENHLGEIVVGVSLRDCCGNWFSPVPVINGCLAKWEETIYGGNGERLETKRGKLGD